MKDEIKEILARLSRYVITPDVRHDFDDLLDYITNLQTIEQQYSFLLSENAELENKITNLQEEKNMFKNSFETMSKNYFKEKFKNEKAIEYMNNYNELVVPDANIKSLILKEEYKKIIELLQGKSDE